MKPVYINSIASIHAGKSAGEELFFMADEPDYKEIITNPALRRRMSRVIKMGVACALECIRHTPSDQIQAIITSTGLGCLADTEKFMNNLLDNEERLLNPTAFIQSTFNTIGAQIALLRQIHAYNVTYAHRGFSFESALLDGMMRICEGNTNALVGAIDELTQTSYTIQQRLGLLKGVKAGEGAQFFLLSRIENKETLAILHGLETFMHPDSDSEIVDRILLFLQKYNLSPQDISCFVTGKNGNSMQDLIYSKLETGLFPKATYHTFKDRCGEYATASSFAVWQTVDHFREDRNKENYALIYNHYNAVNHSLILLSKSL